MSEYLNIRNISILTVAWFLAGPIQAADINYNYVEGRYILDAEIDVGLADIDGDGFHIGGSHRIDKDFYVFGNFETVDFDFNVDVNILEVGAGYIKPIENTKFDANFSFSIVRVDTDNGFGDDEETGYALAGGVRGMLTPVFQGTAKFTHVDVNESDNFLTIAGDFFVQPNLLAGVELDLNGDYETLSLGVKYYY